MQRKLCRSFYGFVRFWILGTLPMLCYLTYKKNSFAIERISFRVSSKGPPWFINKSSLLGQCVKLLPTMSATLSLSSPVLEAWWGQARGTAGHSLEHQTKYQAGGADCLPVEHCRHFYFRQVDFCKHPVLWVIVDYYCNKLFACFCK